MFVIRERLYAHPVFSVTDLNGTEVNSVGKSTYSK
jgi:hypothetical protein